MFRSDRVLDRKTNQRLIERRLFPPFVNFTHELTLKILVFYSRGILNSLFRKHRYFDIFQSDICHSVSVYWEVKRLFFDSKEKKSKTWDKTISCDIVRERTFLPFSFLLERNYTCFQENSRSRFVILTGEEVKSYDIPGSRKMARF